MTTRELFRITLQPMDKYERMPALPVDGITRLKWLLKAAKRYGLRCVSCEVIPPKNGS